MPFVYDTDAMGKARATEKELEAITVRRAEVGKQPPGGAVGPAWTAADLALARPAVASPGGGRVYVHGYTRKDGTYVRAHTRSAPGSGGRRK